MSNTTLTLAVLTLSACAAQGSMTDTTDPSDPTNPTDPTDPTDPSDPNPSDPIVPSETAIAGEYQLRSDLAVTVGSLAPPPAYELLQDLENDPGAALVTIAEAAGVPAAETLFAALPSSLSSRVTGWMTDAIGASAELQTLMAWSQLVLAETEVRSSLFISPLDSEEHASANHVLDSMIFNLDGREIEQDIPSITGLPGAGQADLEIWVERDVETRELVMSEHRFGLLFGEAAYRAFEDAVTARYGTDLRGILGSSLDCAAMAEEVSNQCVFSVCVGHAGELESLCSGALDAAVEQIHDQFTAFDTELLRFSFGSAIVSSNEDGTGTVLETGEWTASADFGLGLRDLEASFTGVSAP